ncbi:hypothetical protein Thiowin_02062 [Thiorhodovibrio winogradskyi]|uniref:Uncharacterized protein n=1 Tax=Thiorhodovibrio winogradskyi TaxID=77007 RepID=A0ABZ0S7X8_9GAMM
MPAADPQITANPFSTHALAARRRKIEKHPIQGGGRQPLA